MKWFVVLVAVWASATLAAGQESSTGTSHAPTTHAPTTHAPTTHAPTTHAPTTHAPTTLAPTTTAAPPTPPVPPVNNYVLRDADNQTCVMVIAALQLKVSYLAKDSKWRDALLVLDNTTTVDPANSSCGHSEQTLALRCGTSLLSMTFIKNETNFLSGIVAEYVLDTVHFLARPAPGGAGEGGQREPAPCSG
uniref:Lysosome-associated membrane glycoprotein 5 n=1 Tax=Ixodes scapularis TaxID=6945 RepID=A0A4D5RVV1_IXOSC